MKLKTIIDLIKENRLKITFGFLSNTISIFKNNECIMIDGFDLNTDESKINKFLKNPEYHFEIYLITRSFITFIKQYNEKVRTERVKSEIPQYNCTILHGNKSQWWKSGIFKLPFSSFNFNDHKYIFYISLNSVTNNVTEKLKIDGFDIYSYPFNIHKEQYIMVPYDDEIPISLINKLKLKYNADKYNFGLIFEFQNNDLNYFAGLCEDINKIFPDFIETDLDEFL